MEKSKKTNNSRIIDKKWKDIFEYYSILESIEENGSFTITSSEINKFKEARLMTKFDHTHNLPDLFLKNDLAILPTKRGTYTIGKYDAYMKLQNSIKAETKVIPFPSWLETIKPKELFSEASVINCAYTIGMLNDLIEDEVLMPTVSGRMSTKEFEFKIKNSTNSAYENLEVKNSQCEIDGGFESTNKFLMIEAKNTLAKDFIIRQLYYPYRLWSTKIKKEVIPIYLTYSNDTFSFYIYKFLDPMDYNSIVLEKQINYIIEEDSITFAEVEKLLYETKIVHEPKFPFPQADRMERVIDLLSLLVQGPLTIEEISTNYAFNQRQAYYYSSAGMYLGLIKREKEGLICLTSKGEKIMSSTSKKKYLSLTKCILEHRVFQDALKLYFQQRKLPTNCEIYSIIMNNNLYRVHKESTLKRRTGTIKQWIKWIVNLPN